MTTATKPSSELPDLDGFDEDLPPVHETKVAISVADTLRKQRKHNLENRTTVEEINGWSGKLFAKYRVLDFDELEEIAKKVSASQHKRAKLYGVCLTLAASCVEMQMRHPETDEITSIAALDSGDPLAPPIRYDAALARILDVEAKGSVEVVLRVFENDMAAIAHHNELMRWMEGQRTKVADEFVGE